MTGYRCRTCGEHHDELPLHHGFQAPAYWYGVPEPERARRCLLSSDQWIIDEEHFFIVGNLELPVIGSDERFSWDVWVSLSDRNFARACELWEQPGRESEPPYFGWLSSSVPGYPETPSLKTMVHTRAVGTRPRIDLEPTDHPLAVEQRWGITREWVQEIAEIVSQGGGRDRSNPGTGGRGGGASMAVSPQDRTEPSMNLDPDEIVRLLPFEERYERRRQRWLDGPHSGWEAFDRVLEREVALNMVRAYNDSLVRRFIRSVRIAASFRHPSFLPVYELGIVGGTTPLYTTPLVQGERLGDLLRWLDGGVSPSGPRFPLFPFVGVVRDACRALEYAHRRGLLHLQLTPDRLLVGNDERLIMEVQDWSPMLPAGEIEADPFVVTGFPAYLSPEQIAGRVSQIGSAADVFALGGILHKILFGRPPNQLPGLTSTLEVLRAIAERAFEPRRSGTPMAEIRSLQPRRRIEGLVGICLKALAYEPEGRYPTAAALGDALDGWLAGCRAPWWAAWRR